MSTPDGLLLAAGSKPLEGELTDRHEHLVARLLRHRRWPDEALVGQSSSGRRAHRRPCPLPSPRRPHTPVARMPPANTPTRRNSVREGSSSRSWLHSMAPRSVCWRPGRSRGPPTSMAREWSSRLRSAARGSDPDPGGGELDGERQPIEATDDLDDIASVLVGQRERRAGPPWPARRTAGRPPSARRRRSTGPRRPSPAGPGAGPGTPARRRCGEDPARRQDRQLGQAGQQPGDQRSALDDLLEVVQDHRIRLAREGGDEDTRAAGWSQDRAAPPRRSPTG